MATATRPTGGDEVSILARMLVNDDGDLPEGVARYILGLEVSDRDQARMRDLAERNREDALTPAEREEMAAFAKATTLLSLLKSRARRALGKVWERDLP